MGRRRSRMRRRKKKETRREEVEKKEEDMEEEDHIHLEKDASVYQSVFVWVSSEFQGRTCD